jgi:hypothetical protein
MSFEQFIVLAAMFLYTAAGASYALKGDAPWALVYLSYAAANAGLIWADINR